MCIKLPKSILRKIIADILIKRGNTILDDADKIEEKEIAESGVSSEYSGEVATTSCGTYVLADDVLSGYISIDGALNEILSSYERELALQKCKEWLKNQNVSP